MISGGATGGGGVGSVTPLPPNNWEFSVVFPIYKFKKSKYSRDLPTLFSKSTGLNEAILEQAIK
jgi:hypothetical protein